jgi:hypothetical protein
MDDNSKGVIVANAVSNGGGTITEQCRGETYVKLSCKASDSLAKILAEAISAAQEMWGLDCINSIPVILGRRPDRITNLHCVASYINTNVKWVYLQDSKCDGVLSIASETRGSGKTTLEWVSSTFWP